MPSFCEYVDLYANFIIFPIYNHKNMCYNMYVKIYIKEVIEMANYTEVEKYLMRTPTENGRRISKEDYTQMNDILRAAFYSVVNKDSYYFDKNEPNKRVHVTKMATGSIQFLKSKEAQRICRSVINTLERTFKNYEQDKPTLKNIWLFAEFSLKNGKSFVFDHLAKEGKMVNWEALTAKLIDKNFNFEQSELLSQFYDKAKELKVKYEKSEPTNHINHSVEQFNNELGAEA